MTEYDRMFLMENKRKTVGLALGSGADKGMAHIGVIKTLIKNNIPIDYISGTSIGAVVAAYYALFLEVDSLEQLFKENTKSRLLNFWNLGLKNSIFTNKKFYNLMRYNLFSGLTFEDTKIPLRIPATNLDNGKEVVFKEGNILSAVLPSMSIPGVFPVVKNGDTDLVDGGLLDAVPVDLLEEFNPDVVIAVDLYHFDLEPKENYSMNDVLNRTYKIYISNLSRICLDDNKKSCLVLRPQVKEKIASISFKNIDEKINSGVIETEKNLERIKELLK